MRQAFLLIAILSSLGHVYSQNYDLIVTNEGDSIACRIDSISKSKIYYQARVRNNWIHTYADTSNLIEYKLNMIDEKSVRFKPGTSIITPPRVIAPSKPVKNAVKTDLLSWPFSVGVLKYERVFSENISVQLGFYYSWDFPVYDDETYFVTGFAITPEFRYYLSKRKPAPRGTYLAPNFRYQKLEKENLEENAEATVINYSPAINLGFQLVLKDLFLVDAWLGLAYNIRNVVEETVPGAIMGQTGNDIGLRGGVSIGLVF